MVRNQDKIWHNQIAAANNDRGAAAQEFLNTITREIERQENIRAQERLIERRLVMEEVGIKKPSVGVEMQGTMQFWALIELVQFS